MLFLDKKAAANWLKYSFPLAKPHFPGHLTFGQFLFNVNTNNMVLSFGTFKNQSIVSSETSLLARDKMSSFAMRDDKLIALVFAKCLKDLNVSIYSSKLVFTMI